MSKGELNDYTNTNTIAHHAAIRKALDTSKDESKEPEAKDGNQAQKKSEPEFKQHVAKIAPP